MTLSHPSSRFSYPPTSVVSHNSSTNLDTDPETFDPGTLPPDVLDSVEADSFWCLSALLDGIQDNYIFAQPGIQRMVGTLRELITRIDAPLAKHLNEEGIEFIQFSFRWMNCLLMREFTVKNVIRMWDTYVVCPPYRLVNSSRKDKRDFQSFMFMFVRHYWINTIHRSLTWIFRFNQMNCTR